VVLTSDVTEKNLKCGDVGTVVHVYDDGRAYEVEFVSLSGNTEVIAALRKSQVRPVKEHEISQARELAIA
jgi:hypothetical protein